MAPETIHEQRLREVETIGIILQTSIKTIHQDISDLKGMFSKVISGSVKIAELETKVRAIDHLSDRVDNLSAIVSNLNNELISIRSRHDVCVLGRGEEGAILKSLQDKIINIEKGNIESGIMLKSINSSKGKVESVIWSWIERAGWLIVITFLFLVLSHSNDIRKSGLDSDPAQRTNQTETMKTFKGK